MDKNEEYVRSVWTWVKTRFSEPHEGYAQGVHVVEGPGWKFSDKDKNAALSAAAAFTRERLEEIRQLREEIEWVNYNSANERDGAVMFPRPKRILSRLEAELSRLQTGMKPSE